MKRLPGFLLYLLLTAGLSLWVWVEGGDTPGERAARARGCYFCHSSEELQQVPPSLQKHQQGSPISPALRELLVQAHPYLSCGAEDELTDLLALHCLQALAEARKLGPGEALYQAKCAACHGDNGEGQAGAYPPLRGSEWLTEEPSRLPEILTRGLDGPISVRGEKWDATMLPPGLDTDEEVQAVIRYLRRRFAK